MVIWNSLEQDGSGYGIYGQRFTEEAEKVGSEFRVNDYTTGNQYYPTATTLINDN